MNADKVLPEVLPFLYQGKGQRICDIKLYFPNYSEEEICEALEKEIAKGTLEKYEGVGGVLYFKKG